MHSQYTVLHSTPRQVGITLTLNSACRNSLCACVCACVGIGKSTIQSTATRRMVYELKILLGYTEQWFPTKDTSIVDWQKEFPANVG